MRNSNNLLHDITNFDLIFKVQCPTFVNLSLKKALTFPTWLEYTLVSYNTVLYVPRGHTGPVCSDLETAKALVTELPSTRTSLELNCCVTEWLHLCIS